MEHRKGTLLAPRMKEYKKGKECLGVCRPCQGKRKLLLQVAEVGANRAGLSHHAIPGDIKAEEWLEHPYDVGSWSLACPKDQ